MEVTASMNTPPESTIALNDAPPTTLEPLLDRAALKAYLKVSEWWVTRWTAYEPDPLPWIGTAKIRRMRLGPLFAWMERNKDAF